MRARVGRTLTPPTHQAPATHSGGFTHGRTTKHMPPQPKCSRPACPNKAAKGYKGHCKKHSRAAGHTHQKTDTTHTKNTIQKLRANGWTYNEIAEASGVSKGTIRNIVNHTYHTVRRATHDAITDISHEPRHSPVPSWRAARRIQALRAAGMLTKDIAHEVGTSRSMVEKLSAEYYDTTSRDLFDRVDRLYREQSVKPVGAPSRAVAKHRWPLPMEWWDIDDPQERRGLLTKEQSNDRTAMTADIMDAAQWLVDYYGAREAASEGIGLHRSALGHILNGRRGQITREVAHRVTYMASQTGWAPGRTQEVAA